MREDVGLELRQEFEEAVETVEAKTVAPRTNFPADIMERFHATESDLKALAARHTGLKINGLADKQGYAMVHAARIECRDARLLLEKTRKAENEEAKTFIKNCNAVAKYLTNLIAPTEDALDAEEEKYNAEVEAEKARAQREKAEKIDRRCAALQAVGHPFLLSEITLMNDTAFDFLLATATETFKVKEAQRIEAEAALAKQKTEQEAREAAEKKAKEEAEAAERARLEKIRQEQAEEAKRIEAEREAIRKEREAMEAEKRKAEQAAREKQIAEEAAIKAKAEAERIAREEAERRHREKLEAEAYAKAAEAAKPDAEKILALAKVIQEIALPKLSTDAGRAVMTEIDSQIGKFVAYLEGKAKALSPIINPSAP